METTPRFPRWLRLVHLLLVVAIAAALISGQFADDYRRAAHIGFDLHLSIGIGAACVVALRWLLALVGPPPAAFTAWQRPLLDPRDWLGRVRRTLANAGALEPPHAGLGGLVQFLMLASVGAMSATGLGLAVMIEPGSRAAGLGRALKEVHEAFQPVILGLLALHVGAAVVHQCLRGHPILTQMFRFGRARGPEE